MVKLIRTVKHVVPVRFPPIPHPNLRTAFAQVFWCGSRWIEIAGNLKYHRVQVQKVPDRSSSLTRDKSQSSGIKCAWSEWLITEMPKLLWLKWQASQFMLITRPPDLIYVTLTLETTQYIRGVFKIKHMGIKSSPSSDVDLVSWIDKSVIIRWSLRITIMHGDHLSLYLTTNWQQMIRPRF